MCQLSGYIVAGEENKVCKLVYMIYGTMQGAHDWFKTLATMYNKLSYYIDPCIHPKWGKDRSFTITDTYTDNVWGASTLLAKAKDRKVELAEHWEIKDVGENKYFLGM